MESADGIRIEEGVTFGTGGGRDLKCDIYTPAGASNAPAVLVLYGGAWRMGDRGRMRGASLALARHGYVAVAGEYRLTPESPWPAHIHDVKANIRWMRANATRLNIDESKISVQGHSAGAHLALLAAGTAHIRDFDGDGGNPGVPTHLAAAVGVYTPVLFHVGGVRPSGGLPAAALMGEAATEEGALAASPLTYASPTFPPTLLIHGSKDTVVLPSASTRMYDALRSVGVPAELHMYANLPHGFARLPSMLNLVQDESANFLLRHVVAPSRIEEELKEQQAQMAAQQAAVASL